MSESVRERPGAARWEEPEPGLPSRAVAPPRNVGSARERILQAARALFCAGGYERTPLRAISDALGVTKAAVYYHFKAKEDLLVAIVSPTLDRIDHVVDAVDRPDGWTASSAERRALLGAYVRELADHRDVTALLLRDPAVAEHRLGRRFARQRNELRLLLGETADPASVIRTTMALHALELVVLQFGDADRARVASTALDIALAVLDLEVRADTVS